MVSSSPKMMAFTILLSLSLLLLPRSALAGLICEDLPQDLCAFAISSSSTRCVLESIPHEVGGTEYQCQTSEVVVQRMSDWIETDECVRACGVDRNTVGISSDSLLEPQFTQKLCSPACHQNCPNIIDLYFNLAAAEGFNGEVIGPEYQTQSNWANGQTFVENRCEAHIGLYRYWRPYL